MFGNISFDHRRMQRKGRIVTFLLIVDPRKISRQGTD